MDSREWERVKNRAQEIQQSLRQYVMVVNDSDARSATPPEREAGRAPGIPRVLMDDLLKRKLHSWPLAQVQPTTTSGTPATLVIRGRVLGVARTIFGRVRFLAS